MNLCIAFQIEFNMQPQTKLVLLSLMIFVSLRIHAQNTGDSLVTFLINPEALQEDFQLLRRVLTETHPGLYRYTSRERMQEEIDSISSLLNKPMSFYDYYLILSKLIADVRCAHTDITPTQNVEAYYFNKIKTFPLMIFFIEDRCFVTINGTGNQTIKPGFELLTINNEPVSSVKNKIMKYLWADGYNETLKAKNTSEIYFPLFYYLLVARPESFHLTLRSLNGEEVKITVPAQQLKETRSYFRKNKVNKEILSAHKHRNKLEQKKGWRLDIHENENTGVLRIKGFGGGNNEEEARLKIRTFLDDCMKKLQAKKIQNLIIDLRYNGGGWDIQGVELYTYIMKEPTRCYRRLHSIADSSEFLKFSDLSHEDLVNIKSKLKAEADGTFSVKEEFSEQMKLQYPKPNRFTGQVYILANGGSASTTAEFIAYACSNKTAILIGEETGGAYEGGNGGSFLNFKLPNSGIQIGTPLLFYENEVTVPEHRGRGTIPDYFVPYTIADILKGYDTQLNFTLELIKRSEK